MRGGLSRLSSFAGKDRSKVPALSLSPRVHGPADAGGGSEALPSLAQGDSSDRDADDDGSDEGSALGEGEGDLGGGPSVQFAALPPGPIDQRTVTIKVNSMSTANFMLQGKVRAVGRFYDGFQVVQVGEGDTDRTSTSYRFPIYSEANAMNVFIWKEGITLQGVSLNSASEILLEMQTILEIEKDGEREQERGAPVWGKVHKLMEKKAFQNKPQVVGWTSISLIDSNGVEREGHQTIPVYHLPIIFKDGTRYAMKGTTLEFEIHISRKKDLMRQMAGARRRSMAQLHSMAHQEDEMDITGVPSEAWVRARHGLRLTEAFQPGDGCVIRVDGGRFFPENVTVTKVSVRFINSDFEQIGKTIESYGSLDSSAYFPRYRLRCLVDTEAWDDPTIMALFTVETLDSDTEEFCTVGYAALSMFLDTRTESQPKANHSRDFALHAGSFQIPLHTAIPQKRNMADIDLENENARIVNRFDAESFKMQPRLSCSSLLVRLLTVSEDDRIMSGGDRLPEYSAREYDTRQAEPTEAERLMYPFKLKMRSFMSTSELAKTVFFSEEERRILDSDNAKLMAWLKANLKRPDLRNDVMLNYNHSYAYMEKIGFSVAVDGAKNLTKGLPAFAFCSLNPPGVFYKNDVTEDVFLTTKLLRTSHVYFPQWGDGLHAFKYVPYDPHLILVVEVRYLTKGGALVSAGWTGLPIFEKGKHYVASGYYNLPLFQGQPAPGFLEDLSNNAYGEEIAAAIATNRVRIPKYAPSVFVRLLDNQREGELSEPAVSQAAKPKIRLPKYVPSKYLGQMRKESKSKKTFEKAKPKKAEYDEWLETTAQQAAVAAGIAPPESLLEEISEVNLPEDSFMTNTTARSGGGASTAGGPEDDDEYGSLEDLDDEDLDLGSEEDEDV